MTEVTLAVDVMGGDHGVSVTLPAIKQMLQRHASLKIIAVGRRADIEAAMGDAGLGEQPRFSIHDAEQVVTMDDPVAVALRQKKQSSMRLAINLVKSGDAQAAVSAGNTGALMAISRFVLKTLPGVERPAICTIIPTATGHCHMLDLGANVDSEPHHLLQFALMGNALVKAVDGLPSPRVALLNIGEEDIKGNEQIKDAAALLKAAEDLNYSGFIEGDGIFAGEADVVVCDGFVGNVALKTMEGVATMISGMVREEASRSLLRKLCALMALPVFKGLKARLNPERYNGATLLGLNGIVVKSHGGTGVEGFTCALQVAMLEAERDVPTSIGRLLAANA